MNKYISWFVDECYEGCRMKRLHGVVDRYYDRNSALTMLVPFHILARALLSLWYGIRVPRDLWWERDKRDEIQRSPMGK